MESFFPSIGNYKINIQINDISLDDCSFARSIDTIRPYFEHSVSNDPDVTGLTVFLRDSNGTAVGWKVIYELEIAASEDESETGSDNEVTEDTEDGLTAGGEEQEEGDSSETEQEQESTAKETSVENQTDQYFDGDELFFLVKSLDNLPVFPMPNDLPMGRYTLVFHVMSGQDVLQKIEKNIFYLSGTDFSYEGINVHLPGIAETSQFIPRATVIMLEANVKFDTKLNPYIVWYNGRVKIHEGKFSDGADSLFWQTPEESGFYSIKAVIYPLENYRDLSGYQKDISLLVSSKQGNIHLISEVLQKEMLEQDQDLNRYIFERNLNDSKIIDGRTLLHSRNSPKWKAYNGTYGVATGFNNNINIPKLLLSNSEKENWQILFRFKPLNDGGIFSIRFGKTNNVYLHLYLDGPNLILTLTSPNTSVSQVYTLLRQKVFEYLPDIVFDETGLVLDETLMQEFVQTPFVQTQFVQTPFVQQTTAQQEAVMQEIQIEFDESDLIAQIDDFSATINSNITQTSFAAQRSEKLRAWIDEDGFIIVNISFSIQEGLLSAKLNVLGDYIDSKLADNTITLETIIENEFQIILGSLRDNIKPLINGVLNQTAEVRHEFTAIWDEFVFYLDKGTEDSFQMTSGLHNNSFELQSDDDSEKSPMISIVKNESSLLKI